ncbi:hypothetical protein IGI37_003824 [Enterococcus sp. AZ194]|uniref:hypothetical protein n=1 Tax=Enterococcus sp. AZ194 TaxID=2774629 RepID=UPI003F242587
MKINVKVIVAFRELYGKIVTFITIDSNTILEASAIEERLYFFFDEIIMSEEGL